MSPASYSYGNVVVHQTATATFLLTNSGSSSLTITAYRENNQDYVPVRFSFPVSLAAGASAKVVIAFTPVVAASAVGQIGFVTNSGDSARAYVSGVGVDVHGRRFLYCQPDQREYGQRAGRRPDLSKPHPDQQRNEQHHAIVSRRHRLRVQPERSQPSHEPDRAAEV